MLMSSMFEREIIPKPLRSDTALATFINSALLNLCSDSSEIRVKALNLTGVIAKRYGLAGFETIYPEGYLHSFYFLAFTLTNISVCRNLRSKLAGSDCGHQ